MTGRLLMDNLQHYMPALLDTELSESCRRLRSWNGGVLNSRLAARPLSLVEGEERWKASNHPQDILSQNWGEPELNRSVTCMVLKATANDRRHLALCHEGFLGP
ncbi:uncharacterized protein TNCV_4911571 [Trichonephila clavipes]|nr:uncharacterized protein TNCV_4911571 [Trichonephila clavipes]